MSDDTIWLTQAGYDKLRAELDDLKKVQRPAISKAIGVAREHGDLKENAEYHSAREQQGMIEARIKQVEHTIASARIMEKPADDKVRIGCTVILRDVKRNKEITYMLVSEAESDFKMGRLSVSSPVGSSLLGIAHGEHVEITVPAGTLTYEVLSISF